MTEWTLILGMVLVTFIPRYLPFALLDKLNFPEWFATALTYVPIAVLTVIVAQNTFFLENELTLTIDNHRLLTGVVAVIVALFTRSLWWTLILGGTFFACLTLFFLPTNHITILLPLSTLIRGGLCSQSALLCP